MKKLKVPIVNKSRHPMPEYATPQSAGLDVRANIDEDIVLEPLCRKLIPTGLYMALPVGYEAQVRPRSGLALKHGVTVLNSPGTVDADYRGEIGVVLIKFCWSLKNLLRPLVIQRVFSLSLPPAISVLSLPKINVILYGRYKEIRGSHYL